MSDLRERVARAVVDADNSPIPDNYYTGTDPSISDWAMYMADAAIALVLDEAAKVADGCDDGSSQEGPLTAYHIAAAVRALKEERT